jgi:glucose 1-dehydrogenase
MRFQDQVAIVTGAGSGIGRATSLLLAREGAKVVVVDFNDAHGEQVMNEIRAQGGKSFFIHCDVSKTEEIKNVIDKTLSHFNSINLIVNNAALMTFNSFWDVTVEDWDRVMVTNLRAAFLFCKFAVPHMKNGSIVNISSVHGHQTTPNNSPYAASKGGIEAMTRAMSLEVSMDHIRINAVAPGAVNTPMLWANPNVTNGKEKIQGKIAEPQEIASAICFLLSKEASFIHGTTLVVDGGRLDYL